MMPSAAPMKKYLLALAMALLVCVASPATATDSDATKREDVIGPDGVAYKKRELIDDFVDIAFSTHGGSLKLNARSNASRVSEVANIDGFSEIVEDHYPWFSDFFNDIRRGQFSDPFAIHKWEVGITIGLGWPGQSELNIPADLERVFVDEIHSLKPELESATGLPVSYMPAEAEDVRIGQYARIRIVPQLYFGQKSVFKTLGVHPKRTGNGPPPTPIEHIEEALFTALIYTPESTVQVDGYYVPNSDNSIGFAVCKVYPRLHELLLRSMIRECLVRSLGLSEMSEAQGSGVLSEWNDVNASASKTYRRDGDDALYSVQAATAQSGQQESSDAINKVLKSVDQEVSPSDLWRIRLLYCKEIRPGMGLYEVVRILTRNKQCWSTEGAHAD